MKVKFSHISVITSAVLAGSLLLSGCGGGGDNPPPSSPTTSSITITGTAVDELILNGVIKVRKNSASGEIVKTGRTSSTDGTYTIEAPGFDGVAVIEVTCDASSQILVNGATQSCPLTKPLYSAAPVTKNSTVTANTSPATHVMFMMATQGNTDATIDPQTLEQARLAAAQVFATDPILSDPTTGIYADVIEAFHEAAADSSKSIEEIIEEISTDAADGVFGNDTNLTSVLAEKMKENNITTEFADNNGTYTPEVPDDAATLDDVQAAKDFFANLRTQGEDLFKDGGLFDSEAQSMQSLLENVTLNGDLAGTIIGNLLDAVGYAIDNNLTDHNRTLETLNGDTRVANLSRTDLNEKIWSYTITDTKNGTSEQRGSGTITLPAAVPADIDPSAFTTLTAAFDGTIPATKLFEQTQSTQTFKANATMTKTTDGAHLEVSDITLSTTDGTMIGIKGFKADAGYDYNASNQNDPMTLKYIKLNEITLNGALDQNYTGTGTLKVGYAMNGSMADDGFINETYTTTIEGNIVCIHETEYYQSGIYANSQFTIQLDNRTINIPTDANGWFRRTIDGQYQYNDLMNANITFDQSTCPTSTTPTLQWFNSYVENDTKIRNSGYIPNTMTLDGNLTNVQTGTEYQGMVGVELLNAADINVSSEDDPHVKVTLSGTLKRAGLNDMSLNLQAENNPDTNISTASLAYVYGTTTVNAQSTISDEGDGNITITSGSGLAITIVLDNGHIDYNTTTPLTKDGKVVGNLVQRNGVDMIKYIDGFLESLY